MGEGARAPGPSDPIETTGCDSAIYEDDLAPRPEGERARELWLQRAAGFILFEDMRRYARDLVSPRCRGDARDVAFEAIDDALYGLVMVVDGVSGWLGDGENAVRIAVSVRLLADDVPVPTIDIRTEGDGTCMESHGRRDGDFGVDPVAVASSA